MITIPLHVFHNDQSEKLWATEKELTLQGYSKWKLGFEVTDFQGVIHPVDPIGHKLYASGSAMLFEYVKGITIIIWM